MTPAQREAALRLADDMDTPITAWADQVVDLLRELAAAPQQRQPNDDDLSVESMTGEQQ
jgi:hypothetical protein